MAKLIPKQQAQQARDVAAKRTRAGMVSAGSQGAMTKYMQPITKQDAETARAVAAGKYKDYVSYAPAMLGAKPKKPLRERMQKLRKSKNVVDVR